MRGVFSQRFFCRLLVLCLSFAGLPAFGAGVVTNATQADLLSAMAGGGTVNLAFNGTITLESAITVATNTLLMASNHNVTISGSNAVELFVVPQSVTFALSNLVLADGLAQGGYGGAISNNGTVQVVGCVFSNNGAQGYTTYFPSAVIPGQGGAIFNAGTLLVSNALFVMNWTQGASGNEVYGGVAQGTPGQGGAIFNAGMLLMSNAVFVTNRAEGGPGVSIYDGPTIAAANGDGGAFYNSNYAVIDNCLFNANSAIGGPPVIYGDCPHMTTGPGSVGGDATGGAIHNSSTLVIIDSIFASNNCAAGLGGDACSWGNTIQGGSGGNASGAGVFSATGTVSLVGTTFSGNFAVAGDGGAGTESGGAVAAPGGNGGNGGQAAGGSVYLAAGSLSAVNCTFVNGTISAGYGGYGGQGALGMVGLGGGSGGNGGNAPGGAICVSGGSAFVTNVTFSANVSVAGNGGIGGSGLPSPPGPDGTNGLAEGNSIASGPGILTLLNSILSCASGQTNAFGPIIDAGYNLNSDTTVFLTNVTSLNGVAPKQGMLGNYGGPTPTIPLLPGSMAIDHANPTNFPPTDQRGYPRPFGSAPDIGAFEYWPYSPNSLSASIDPNGMFDLIFWGTNGQSFTTLATSDLIDWMAISTNTILASNQFEMFLPMNDGAAFYQTLSR